MKKFTYRSILRIYLIIFMALLSVVLFVIIFSLSIIRIPTTDGTTTKSNFPKVFTENFREEIVFIDDTCSIKPSGMELLQSNQVGIQILNEQGQEILNYQKPENAKDTYSIPDLLLLSNTGHGNDNQITSFLGSVTHNEKDYTYILHFPLNISKITMYLNGNRFTAGKSMILLCAGIVFFISITAAYLYGFWITKTINLMSLSVKKISQRAYIPISNKGVFHDVFESLNALHTDIKESDIVKEETENMRKEWIANITHDLKAPLSPIKGYAEFLSDKETIPKEQRKKYTQTILKNVSYMESLIEDLKLTYQLDNHMIPMQCMEHNIVRFLKEVVIDVLNHPEYENRVIHFQCKQETILFSFDHAFMMRAFRNLLLNAFIHGNDDTEVFLQISVIHAKLQIIISDNGNGMNQEEVDHAFDRYYRGINSEKKTMGTGLGLAITKSIIEAQGGTISIASDIGMGTTFTICFPLT